MINLHDVSAVDCGTAIEICNDPNLNLNVHGLTMVRVNKGVVIRDAPGVLARLGLPVTTPPEFIAEIVEIMQRTEGAQDAARREQLGGSKLAAWLGGAADLATIGTALLAAVGAG